MGSEIMVKGSKTQKLILDGHGSYLGMEKGCFTVRDKQGKVQRFPLFENEIGEVILKSGNMVSTGALASLGFWDVDVLIMTQRGRPVAMLKSLDDDSHVKTRLCQYEALKDGRAFEIAKQFVKGKIEGQNTVLKKYGLKTDTSVKLRIDAIETKDLKTLRRKLMQIEAKFSQFYFKQVFQLIPERIRPESRRTFKAYDGVNNLFNLAYELFAWKVHRALVSAKLEPYLGFLHSEQFGKPSLVCDFQELYRHLIDDFIIQYCKKLIKRDFTFKAENMSAKKKGKREYLNDVGTKDFTARLNDYFETTVEIPRMKVGERQTIETLINEEALLFAKHLRNEIGIWSPRIALHNSQKLETDGVSE
jgi:CRISPR-associated protein Cas1